MVAETVAKMSGFNFCLMIFLLFVCFPTSDSFTAHNVIAFMDAWTDESKGQIHSHTACLTYQPKFSEIPSSPEEAVVSPFVDLYDDTGCSSFDFVHPLYNLSGSAVAVSSWGCAFTQKAYFAMTANVSSILIINYEDSTILPIPSLSESGTYGTANITVASISWNDYRQIKSLPAPVTIKIYSIKLSHKGQILILFGSTFIIAIGALLVVQSEKQKAALHIQISETSQSDLSDQLLMKTKTQVLLLCLCTISFMAIVILFLYFFHGYGMQFLRLTFYIVGSLSLLHCLWPAWSNIFTGRPKNTKAPHRFLIVFIPFGILWALLECKSYYWIFQNILGTAICILCFKSLRFQSLKVISPFLVFVFFYDLLSIFITPLFTNDGRNVVDIITRSKTDAAISQGISHNQEVFPNVFIIPQLTSHPVTMCNWLSHFTLGIGDVAIPGIIIVYNALFDVHAKSKMAYFISSLIGYFFGMAVCIATVVYTKSIQPAVVYILPAVLIPTFATAAIRRELRAIWSVGPDTHMASDIPTGSGSTNLKDKWDDNDREISHEEKHPLRDM